MGLTVDTLVRWCDVQVVWPLWIKGHSIKTPARPLPCFVGHVHRSTRGLWHAIHFARSRFGARMPASRVFVKTRAHLFTLVIHLHARFCFSLSSFGLLMVPWFPVYAGLPPFRYRFAIDCKFSLCLLCTVPWASEWDELKTLFFPRPVNFPIAAWQQTRAPRHHT